MTKYPLKTNQIHETTVEIWACWIGQLPDVLCLLFVAILVEGMVTGYNGKGSSTLYTFGSNFSSGFGEVWNF